MSLKEYTVNGADTTSAMIAGELPNYPYAGPEVSKIFTFNPGITEVRAYISSESSKGHSDKLCDHYQREASHPGGGTLPIPIYFGSGYYGLAGAGLISLYNYGLGTPDYPFSGFPGALTSSPTGGILDPPGLDAIIQRSLNSLLPYVKANLSLINTIIEVKDVKSIRKTLTKIKALPALFKGGFDKRKTLRALLQAGADVYLQKEFNILPLLSDIRGIQTSLLKTERRVNDLVSREGKPQNKHFTYSWLERGSMTQTTAYSANGHVASEYWPISAWASESAVEILVVPEATTFHAQIKYNYNYTKYQREHAHILGLADSLGVNLNPQIIWNAIPWSFVVDWVANVGGYLGNFTIHALEPQINIHSFLYSYKRARRAYSTLRVHVGLPNNEYDLSASLPTVSERTYKRVPMDLPGSSIVSSGLSAKEFSLGAALVISRRRRRKHKPSSAG